jgi:hypothetical protein
VYLKNCPEPDRGSRATEWMAGTSHSSRGPGHLMQQTGLIARPVSQHYELPAGSARFSGYRRGRFGSRNAGTRVGQRAEYQYGDEEAQVVLVQEA